MHILPKFILFGCILFLFSCTNNSHDHKDQQIEKTDSLRSIKSAPEFINNDFDIPQSDQAYIIDTGQVKSNQILSQVLAPFQVPYTTIQKIVDNSKGVFNIRRIKAGNTFYIYSNQSDSGKEAKYFVYKDSPVKYIVFNLQDSFGVYEFKKQVDTTLRTVNGSITKTLYHTIIDIDAPFELGEKLAQVYAWQVDFFHIQKNDHFKVLFEELSIDGESIGVGKILAASFKHHRDTFRAYFYDKPGFENYYDHQGKSLRKAFLKAPLKYSRISSRFSRRRFHPVQKRWKAHLGTDYAAKTGTPILAVGDGTVIAAAYGRGNGRYVKIKHNATYTTQYLHMSRFGKGIRKGVHVKQGTVIGYVGSTGLATGPHLCYRFWVNGVQTDPFRVKMPPSKSIDEEERVNYFKVMNGLQMQLDSI